MQRVNGCGFQKKNMRVENMNEYCCVFCEHCDDDVIVEQTGCKCHCHARGQNG